MASLRAAVCKVHIERKRLSSVFTFESVSKKYGDQIAVSDISLDVKDGKVTALIGPSGCGKSTLLKMMIGLQAPSSGMVSYKGQPVARLDKEAFRQKVGYVIQSGGMFPHLSASDNVTIMARYLGWSQSDISNRITELQTLTDLSGAALQRYPAELSGGQRQRVALMRALMLRPEVLLLDEPLGALDTIIRHDLQSDLKAIFSELNMTVVIVTHDMAEAAYLSDTIVLLGEGRIVQQGTIDELYNKPAEPFVNQFLTSQRHVSDLVGG